MSEPDETWEDVVAESDPRFDLESPVAGRDWLLEGRDESRPETELEAMMRSAPGEPIPDSTESQHAKADRIMSLLETELNETERAVIEATIIAGHSIRRAARMLGLSSSSVHRIQQSALERLRRLAE